MLRNHNLIAAAFEPEDLQMLQQVLEKICDHRGITKSTGHAADIAADVINLYQHGVRREVQLLAMLTGKIGSVDVSRAARRTDAARY